MIEPSSRPPENKGFTILGAPGGEGRLSAEKKRHRRRTVVAAAILFIAMVTAVEFRHEIMRGLRNHLATGYVDDSGGP